MDGKSLSLLEFPKIQARLADLAVFAVGKELAEALLPQPEPLWVAAAQEDTAEALALLWREGGVPWGGLHDLRPLLHRATLGAVLEAEELLAVADTLRGMARLRRFMAERSDRFPRLAALAESLPGLPELGAEIQRCITEHAEVADAASPALARLRAQSRTLQNRLREKLDSLVTSPEVARYLQEPLVTLRNDRYVIPVRREYKSMVPGVVHDQSASGATLFVEPMAVVELNNQLRQVNAAEQEEVRRILSALSAQVAAAAPDLEAAMGALGRFDFMLAKGKLAREMEATLPRLNREGRLRLRQARHPLLAGTVVPVDVMLGEDFITLVITGPNTGGKTVTLKTIGLLTLMAQAGLHIPAGEGSEVAIFSDIFADIGDEQSIEQNLSTFSSHLTNIVRLLDRLTDNCLVLLDELGAGTDPTEGAALAMALLDHLHRRGTRTVATTHYPELKAFAYTRPGVENASVEFDVETLRPTYRLAIGIPGRSNAFEIAARLGLSEEIIAEARRLTSREASRMEDVLRAVAENRRLTEEHRLRAEEERHRLENLSREYDAKLRRLTEEKEQILARARKEGEELLQKARREVDQLLTELRRQIREAPAGGEEAVRQARQRLADERERLRHDLSQREAVEEEALPQAAPTELSALQPGVRVRIVRFGQEGVVLAPPTPSGEVLVQAGSLRMTLRPEDVAVLPPAPPGRRPATTRRPVEGHQELARSKAGTIRSELDLRGLTVDEAWELVTKYLDDASLAGLSQVRLIHGKGTGALRQGLRERLGSCPGVAEYRYAAPAEGGDGVTIVRLEA
ncbi:MAG: endonuclease MutS2 [Bacillota bacterium]|nr:endonuclease MutS2 [Bacillota bacterium]